MNSFIEMVIEFHKKMESPIRENPTPISIGEWELRHALLKEEYQEYKDSINIIDIADAYADMIYVIIGNCLVQGIDLESVFREVHISNMTKVKGNLQPNGKIKKGPEFISPNIAKAMDINEKGFGILIDEKVKK